MARSISSPRTEQIYVLAASTRIKPTRSARSALQVPPGNRLEQLAGDREGQYSIRINEQWRLCFRWEDGNAYEVEVTDDHRG
jgi:plasmid maintenance system killer protein